jgi:hypothetical protein
MATHIFRTPPAEQFRDASTYWNSVGTALNSSEMLVLTGGLQYQLLSVQRFQYLLDFCNNSSELFRNASAYWISARRALKSFKMPARNGVL